ncbi:MAG: geranylgeranylglyceryl/heptaprenylglyceryl phosphate synthase [Microbacter sp.]
MEMSVYALFVESIRKQKKLFLLLMDPDHFHSEHDIVSFLSHVNKAKPDLILLGGSITTNGTETLLRQIKKWCSIPVVLFPGNTFQFTPEADALLLLTLISGRNPDLLIGQHVVFAQVLKQSGIETISTGYLLVESGQTTAVEYISNTRPIPRSKPGIAAATALAGTMIGNRLIYLEAGSGAEMPVPSDMIAKVKQTIDVPLIVGGGLRTTSDLIHALAAGADAVVVGNVFEHVPELIKPFVDLTHDFRMI